MGPIAGVLFDGFAYGMLLFLLSVGLSVTLGMMNFVNLAHCAFAMLGGYVTVTLTNRFGWPFLTTLPFAFLSAAVVSVVLERTLYRRLYRASDLDQVLPHFEHQLAAGAPRPEKMVRHEDVPAHPENVVPFRRRLEGAAK